MKRLNRFPLESRVSHAMSAIKPGNGFIQETLWPLV